MSFELLEWRRKLNGLGRNSKHVTAPLDRHSRRLVLGLSVSLLTACFFHRFVWIAASDFLVPRWVMCPRPRVADGAAGHRLNGARFAECAEIYVHEDAGKHDQRR